MSTNIIYKLNDNGSTTSDTERAYNVVTSHAFNLDRERWNLPMNANNEHTVSTVSRGKAAVNKLPTVLVIDDSEQLLTLLETILHQFDYNVVLASSGSSGIDTFMEDGADVVLCDLTLPDLNGWKVAQFIQDYCAANERLKPPFILMTGWAQELEFYGGSTGTGVDMVVAKPMDTKLLLNTISHLLKQQEDVTEIQLKSVHNGMTP
jgi:CheY-like chemotaxis protein